MLLADELIQAGMKQSHHNLAAIESMKQIIEAHSLPNEKLENVARFACKRLEEMGCEYKTEELLKEREK